jgi:hypothetical protein
MCVSKIFHCFAKQFTVLLFVISWNVFFTCFAKNCYGNHPKRFAKWPKFYMFCFLAKQKSTVTSKSLVRMHEVNRSFYLQLLFRKMFPFRCFAKLFVKLLRNVSRNGSETNETFRSKAARFAFSRNTNAAFVKNQGLAAYLLGKNKFG